MKTKLLSVLFGIILTCYAVNSNAQANQKLSNLTAPTAVNQSLLPGANNTIDLGKDSLRWKNIYLGNALYLKGAITVHMPGTNNFFVGFNAGNTSLTGSYNTATGLYSLFTLTSGKWNTANGYYALIANTTGSANTAIGYYSLYYSTGGGNTASGNYSIYRNTTGSYNTASGDNSLNYNTTGKGNTAIGALSLTLNSTGSYNTALGYAAGVVTVNYTNATAIGYNVRVNASNKVIVGNTSVTSIGGQVGWSIFSDGRYKKDIKENVQGLAFINSLRPITYTVNVQGLNEYYNTGRKQVVDNAVSDSTDEAANAEIKKGEEAAAKIVYNGFVAQEVEEAAKKLNFEFSGIDKPQSKEGLYSLRYDNFIVPLVKAVQELSKQNDELNLKVNQFENLKMENQELRSRLHYIEQQLDIASESKTLIPKLTNISLEQNIPNPFNHTTIINYASPQIYQSAKIIITDKNGKIMKEVSVSGGKGSLNVDASAFSSGAYQYSLIIDGKLMDTKQMMVQK